MHLVMSISYRVVRREPVRAWLRLDHDALGWAYRLTQFAGNTALLTIRVAAKRMFTTEAKAFRRLLVRVVQGRFRLEHVAQGHAQSLEKLQQQIGTCEPINPYHVLLRFE